MATGWKAAKESRRAHTQEELKSKPSKHRIDKRRRQSAKDRMAAMKLRGELTSGKSDALRQSESDRERRKQDFIKAG